MECFIASQRAALMPMNFASGANAVHDPVVKSMSRVPTASTTSASAASALAEVEPTMPMGPAWTGWSWVSVPLPAMVSTTGMPRRAANAATASLAPE